MAGMKYSDIVDYDKLDPFKEEAMRRARATFGYPNRLGIRLLEESVGSTAAVFEWDAAPDAYVVFGVEGLGTKNLVAEAMAKGRKFGQRGLRLILDYALSALHISISITTLEKEGISRRALSAGLGQDEMAMTLNDVGAVGATPVAFAPIHALGESSYFDDVERRDGMLDGYDAGAAIAKVAIPCGETPTLKGIVHPNTMDLAGGSWGIIRPKSRLVLGQRMEAGLAIYGVESSGIHSNGLSLARRIVEERKLPDGYFTRLPSGRTFGEALLTPTHIYAPLVEALFEEGVDVRFMQPITGHGWAKIMRHKAKPLKYVIEQVPEPQEEFALMREAGPVDTAEAYRVWNMRVGWVVFAPAQDAGRVSRACGRCGLKSYELGHTESGEREVVIAPLNLTYRAR